MCEGEFQFSIYLFAFNFSDVCQERRLLSRNRFFLSCRGFERGYFDFCNFHLILWVITAIIWCPESLCFISTSYDLNWRHCQVWVEKNKHWHHEEPQERWKVILNQQESCFELILGLKTKSRPFRAFIEKQEAIQRENEAETNQINWSEKLLRLWSVKIFSESFPSSLNADLGNSREASAPGISVISGSGVGISKRWILGGSRAREAWPTISQPGNLWSYQHR